MTATVPEAHGKPQQPAAVTAMPVALAEGVELLGEYADSGFSTPQYLLRRPDGQVILVSRLLHLVTAALAEHDRLEEVAAAVTAASGRRVTAEHVAHLLDTKLRPAGLLAEAGHEPDRTQGHFPGATRANPLLGLTLRVGVVPERVHRAATRALRPLVHLPAVLAVLAAVVSVDVWVIARRHLVLDASLEIVSHPLLLLLLTAGMFVSMAFHELGHATACRSRGGRPSAMGVGVYLVWPAFYTDVSDAYRLDRRGRLCTDLGGIYFNLVFALAAAAAYAGTGSAVLLGMVVLPQLQALYQLLPFVRLDGYYILGDLIGVPNLFAYLRAATATLLPTRPATRRRADQRMATLRSPARRAVRTWVALTVPVLATNVALAAFLAPRTLPTLWHTAERLFAGFVAAVGAGRGASAANAGVQLLVLVIPVLGWGVLIVRGTTLLTRWAARSAGRHRPRPTDPDAFRRRRRVAMVASVAVVAVAAGAVALCSRLWSRPDGRADRQVATAPAAVDLRAAGRASTALVPVERAPADAAPPSTSSSSPPPSPSRAAAADAAGRLGERGPSAPSEPPRDPDGGTRAPAGIAEDASAARLPGWTVQPGESFWTIAAEVVGAEAGRPAVATEVRSYWLALVEANRSGLVDPGDPDLLLPGQQLLLPGATAAATSSGW